MQDLNPPPTTHTVEASQHFLYLTKCTKMATTFLNCYFSFLQYFLAITNHTQTQTISHDVVLKAS